MEYSCVRTLKHQSKFKIALSLLQKKHIIDGIFSDYLTNKYSFIFCGKLANQIRDSVANLSLPLELKADLFEVIGSVQQQIVEYLHLCADKLYKLSAIERICIENIFWTQDGVIDKRKSFKYLVDNAKHIFVVDLYLLSCEYCLDENLLKRLWLQVKEKYSPEDLILDVNLYSARSWSVLYWSHYLDNTLSEFSCDGYDSNRTEEIMFELPYHSPITTEAAIYFYNKIPKDNQQRSLLCQMKILFDDTPSAWNAELIILILSKLNEENRLYIIHQLPHLILRWLLESWPWRDFYLLVFDKITYLTEDGFLKIINGILHVLGRGDIFPRLNLQFLFSNIWNRNISRKYKKCIDFFKVFSILLDVGDIKNVMLISMDKELENVRLIHLAFLIIKVNYSHLLKEFEDLVNEEIKLENIGYESLQYCLSEFLKHGQYKAFTEILCSYFVNGHKEIDTFKSNFPVNAVLMEAWRSCKNYRYYFQCLNDADPEGMLQCIFGRDEKKVQSAKEYFLEENLYDVYSFLLNNNNLYQVQKFIAWAKTCNNSCESNLKSRYRQEYSTEICLKLISRGEIHDLNDLVNYLYDQNPREFITNFILHYGVQSCISFVSFLKISEVEETFMVGLHLSLCREFFRTWVKYSNVEDILRRELTMYGEPSTHGNDVNVTNNIFEPNEEKLRKWEIIDNKYRAFMNYFNEY